MTKKLFDTEPLSYKSLKLLIENEKKKDEEKYIKFTSN